MNEKVFKVFTMKKSTSLMSRRYLFFTILLNVFVDFLKKKKERDITLRGRLQDEIFHT